MASLTSSHEFWVGLLIGIVIGAAAPWWLALIAGGVAFIATGFFQAVGHHANSAVAPEVVVGVIALVAGLYFGRMRGLKHLGEHEFRTRRGYIRGISRF